MILIRDLLLSIDQRLPLPDPAIVRGRIVSIASTRERCFVQLSDQSGIIQVMAASDCIQPVGGELWEFEGKVDVDTFRRRGEESPRPTIIAIRSTKVSLSALGARSQHGTQPDVHQRFLERGVSLALLRSISGDAFADLGFIEVEPKLITLSSPLTGLEPIQLSYVGFGAPAHLFPSPANQLKQILAGTQVHSVFAISRIFTTTFRDESTSNEALTLMAMRIWPDSDLSQQESTTLEQVVVALAAAPQLTGVLADSITADGKHLIAVQMTGAPKPLVRPVKTTTLECYSSPSQYLAEPNGMPPESFQRLVAPERTILAERAIMPWFGAAKLEVTTIHLERLSAVFFDTNARPLTVLGLDLRKPLGARA